MLKARILLFPFSIVYDGLTRLKNFLYNHQILTSTEFQIPLIVIGNLAVGGTGKTPHTEWIANLLKHDYKTAVLSRGYGRKTKGYYVADSSSSSQQIGDEPLQIFNTVKDIDVAVCEDRVTGVKNLIQTKEPDVIILDDAFQHRKITGSLYILLTTYQKLFYNDYVLPAGNLREASSNKNRADIIIVTKCPSNLSEKERQNIIDRIGRNTTQKVFFSQIQYHDPVPFDSSYAWNSKNDALLVTGIVNPQPLHNHLQDLGVKTELIAYPDHYDYTKKDIDKFQAKLNTFDSKVLVTTSKDAVKIKPLINNIKVKAFELPIKIGFLFHQEKEFINVILDHVRKV